MSRTDHYFIYPRNKNGERTGHTICVLIRNGKVFHGTSLCSENDQFELKTGREISKARAEEAYNRHILRNASGAV